MQQAPSSSPLAEFLRAEMQARRWTNESFARRCGVSPSLVSRWRNGRTIPEPRNCECIARELGVDRDLVLRLAGHVRPEVPVAEVDDPWATLQREWTQRFDRRVRSLTRSEHDDCTQRTVSAWLDAFSLMVDRLGV